MDELELSSEEVEPLLGRLLIYAFNLMRRLTWRGARVQGKGAIPGWYAPEDFVGDAIAKALDGTRVWNREYYPTAESFLQSIIKSDIGHLASSADNAQVRWLAPQADGEEVGGAYAIPAADPQPLDIIVDRSGKAAYREAVLAELDGDPLLIDIFHAYEAEVTEPAEIAQRLGRSVIDINNAKKRLRRRLAKVDTAIIEDAREGGRGGTTHE